MLCYAMKSSWWSEYLNDFEHGDCVFNRIFFKLKVTDCTLTSESQGLEYFPGQESKLPEYINLSPVSQNSGLTM